jgi:hypothetical protein
METQMGENQIILSYNKNYIHRKHQLPNSTTPTGRRLQHSIYMLQLEGGSNTLFTCSNLKEATIP